MLYGVLCMKMTRKSQLKKAIKNKGSYYLANLESKTYDPTPFKDFKEAVKINLMLQTSGYGDMIVPLKKEIIARNKFKKIKILP